MKKKTDDLDQSKYLWVGGRGNAIFSNEYVCSGQVSLQKIKR